MRELEFKILGHIGSNYRQLLVKIAEIHVNIHILDYYLNEKTFSTRNISCFQG